jgi:hypothetical protein
MGKTSSRLIGFVFDVISAFKRTILDVDITPKRGRGEKRKN